MPDPDLEIQIILAISVMLNLALGFLVVAKYINIRPPEPSISRPRDLEFARYSGAILVGFWGGIVGNAFVSSMFEIQKQNTSPWFYTSVFVICAVGGILITLMLYKSIMNALSSETS